MGGSREPRQDIGIVWMLNADKTLRPVQLRTGITDHTVTEVVQVLHGNLKEGDELIVGASMSKSRGPVAGPGMGGGRPPGR